MSMTDLDQALQLITINDHEANFIGPRDERLVQAAEAALGVLLPPTYRRFLNERGCGDLAGAEFYGLVDDNFIDSCVPDGIWLTLKQRRTINLPRALILVSDTGDGGYYAIDTNSRNNDGECPVILWYPGLSRMEAETEVVAEDFGAFMLHRLRKALQ